MKMSAKRGRGRREKEGEELEDAADIQ